jgi:hypothetical protein
MKAMNRDKVESALDGVDAQMLEMLSDHFLYPSRKPSNPTRPRGRPDFVPGAMKYETMIKYREQKEIDGIAREQQRTRGLVNNKEETADGLQHPKKSERRRASRAKGSGKKKERSTSSDLNSVLEGTKRKQVVKNLPERKDSSKLSSVKRRQVSTRRSKVNNLELQKYYRTELLTADEEYTLGIKIQLLVKCEQVHEGLALQYMRLPTLEEWATACG